MKLGFTGTQRGMTAHQKRQFTALVASFDFVSEFHHGDCIGSDADAVGLVTMVDAFCTVVCHPPTVEAKRAFTPADHTLPALSYMDRNQAIVDACDALVATPKEGFEELRSGTWSTIRRARRRGIPVHILWP